MDLGVQNAQLTLSCSVRQEVHNKSKQALGFISKEVELKSRGVIKLGLNLDWST